MKPNSNIPGWASDIYEFFDWAQKFIPPGSSTESRCWWLESQ
jgi:hypothetical protein